jgi:hypothetical protein
LPAIKSSTARDQRLATALVLASGDDEAACEALVELFVSSTMEGKDGIRRAIGHHGGRAHRQHFARTFPGPEVDAAVAWIAWPVGSCCRAVTVSVIGSVSERWRPPDRRR